MKDKQKNPAAVALGSLGGKANTEKQRIARSNNGKKGGRPPKKVMHSDVENQLDKLDRSSL